MPRAIACERHNRCFGGNNPSLSLTGEIMTIWKKLTAPLLAATVLLGCAANAFAANLLVNGSFEQPGCGSVVGCVLDTPAKANFIPGWTTFLSGVEYVRNPSDGEVGVDLANFIYGNGGGIQQNFATVVGAKYRVTFSLGNSQYANRTGEGVVQLKVAGQTASFDTPSAKGVGTTWATYTYDFTAVTPQTTLAFSNEQNPDIHFAFLDNVIVERL